MDKDLTEDKLYQMTDKFIESEITPLKFYLTLLNKIYQFYDWNGSSSQILFANDNMII